MEDKKILIIFTTFLGIITILPILSPLLAHFGYNQISYWINFFYQLTCHQRPWRSYHIFDLQMSFCAREVGTFIGLFVSSIVVLVYGSIKLSKKTILFILLIGVSPIFIDGLTQLISEIYNETHNDLFPFYESINSIRSITGLIFGTSIGFVLFPFLLKNPTSIKNTNWIKVYLVSLILGILFITIIIFFSYSTSNKFKPSNPYFDTLVRLPGYNYEVTVNGAHTTIPYFRYLYDSTFKYCERAKIYMKDEYATKCGN